MGTGYELTAIIGCLDLCGFINSVAKIKLFVFSKGVVAIRTHISSKNCVPRFQAGFKVVSWVVSWSRVYLGQSGQISLFRGPLGEGDRREPRKQESCNAGALKGSGSIGRSSGGR